ncbi:MAG: carbonic anhydrase [Ilumatobacteraceae bacterium]
MDRHGFPSADELLEKNARFADQFHSGGLALRPTRRLAVVACMDSRMDMFQILGLADGEAHIIRNAGGVVTDDVIRSLVLSQRLLGTEEIILVHHTDCGLQKTDETELKEAIERDTGLRPAWAVESFTDPFHNVRQSMSRLLRNPFVQCKDHIRGFVYDVDTGKLAEVAQDPRHAPT